MSFFSFNNIGIEGMAAAVPSNTVNIDDFSSAFGREAVEKFKLNVGVHKIRRALPGQTASDLGAVAAEDLFTKLNFDRTSIGILVFTSLSQDYLRPATSCVLQYRLGLEKKCAAFDVGMGCSGFTYGLQVASAMLQNSTEEWALLIISDTAGQLMFPRDKSTVMLIGDAGTAVILHKKKESSVRSLLGTDGAYYSAAIVPAGGFRNRDVSKESFVTEDGIERSNYHYLMNGMDIFSFATSEIPRAFNDFFAFTNTAIDDYDSLVLHQANKMIINRLRKKLKAENLEMPMSLDCFGNTSSASIPLSLCREYGNRNDGKRSIICCGFGTGLSYGIASFDIDLNKVFPVIETDEIFEDGLIV